MRFYTIILVTALMVLSMCCANAESAVEDIIPKSFDPHQEYKTYSYDELSAHIKRSFGTTNNFLGEEVKTFAQYYILDDSYPHLNKSVLIG